MTLRAEMVHLIRTHVIDQTDELLEVREIAIVARQPALRIVGVLINMLDAPCIERGRAPNQPMNIVAFIKEQFRQIRTVLSRQAGYDGALHADSQNDVSTAAVIEMPLLPFEQTESYYVTGRVHSFAMVLKSPGRVTSMQRREDS